MDANNRSANEVSEHLRLQNEQLETENKALRKKIGEQANQLKRLENNPHLPPCPAPPKPKAPVSSLSFVILFSVDEMFFHGFNLNRD